MWDFSKNYTFVIQDKPQSYPIGQVIMLLSAPLWFTIKEKKKQHVIYAVIWDCLEHNIKASRQRILNSWKQNLKQYLLLLWWKHSFILNCSVSITKRKILFAMNMTLHCMYFVKKPNQHYMKVNHIKAYNPSNTLLITSGLLIIIFKNSYTCSSYLVNFPWRGGPHGREDELPHDPLRLRPPGPPWGPHGLGGHLPDHGPPLHAHAQPIRNKQHKYCKFICIFLIYITNL